MAVTKTNTRATSNPSMNPLIYGKLPPQAPEMEAAVLGAIMVESNKLADVLDIIQNNFRMSKW
jgi:replicative DNA helicase